MPQIRSGEADDFHRQPLLRKSQKIRQSVEAITDDAIDPVDSSRCGTSAKGSATVLAIDCPSTGIEQIG
jgi:hypothetical protein